MPDKILLRIILTGFILQIMNTGALPQEQKSFDILSTKEGDLEMHFIGHGSLMFRCAGFVIYVDPVSSEGNYESMPKADLILVTHEHFDHLDVKLAEKLRKEGTVMFCNDNSATKVSWAQPMKAGDVKSAGIAGIEAVQAYNIVNLRAPGQPYHPKGTGNGYILTIGGRRIYVAGDTENTPEMKALKNIDVAFLPMNLPYTMTPEMVADAAIAFKPAILYPYHFGDTDTGKLSSLLRNSGIEVRIRDLK